MKKKVTETVFISGFGRKIHIRTNDSGKKKQNEKKLQSHWNSQEIEIEFNLLGKNKSFKN